jgi:hypothetical protein
MAMVTVMVMVMVMVTVIVMLRGTSLATKGRYPPANRTWWGFSLPTHRPPYHLCGARVIATALPRW